MPMLVHKSCLFSSTIPFFKPLLGMQLQCTMSAYKQLFLVKSSILCCSSFCFTGKGKKWHLKPADLPVLDLRLPVARRYSNGLVKSGARPNAFTRLSVFRLISVFSALFSKTNLTDCSQVSSLSYGLKSERFKIKTGQERLELEHQLHIPQNSSE